MSSKNSPSRTPPPARTLEQRRAAAALGLEKRRARMELRLSKPNIVKLLRDPPECIVGTTIYRLLLWERGLGPTKALRLLEFLNIPADKKIVTLNTRAQERVADQIVEWRNFRKSYRRSERPDWLIHDEEED